MVVRRSHAGSKFGLPFLPPSKSTTADFKKGANMAITGATAMDAPFFSSLGLSDKIWNNGPISFQLQWFQQVSSAVCGNGEYIQYAGRTSSPCVPGHERL